MLIGTYVVSTVTGGSLGAAVWPEPSRLSDLPEFLMMAPLFQFIASACSFFGRSPGLAYTGAQPIPFFIFSVCLLFAVVSAAWYWKSRKSQALLALGISVATLSLPGTNMLYSAMST